MTSDGRTRQEQDAADRERGASGKTAMRTHVHR